MRRRTRRVFTHLAAVVCPPELRTHGRAERLTSEFDALRGCLQPAARYGVGPALFVFDQSARLRPGARGRSFTALEPAPAEAHLVGVLAGGGPLATAVRLVKTLMVLCYYELPDVKAELGYDPDPYIERVSARRLARYGPAIRAAEQAALTPDGAAQDVAARDGVAQDGAAPAADPAGSA